MMKKLLHRLFAPFAAMLALSPASAATTAARPALWAVSDADTTVYLFGTIHLLPDNYQWRTPKFDQAMASAQELIVETIVDDKNPQKLMQPRPLFALAEGLPPLVKRLPPSKRPALEAAIKKSGMPPQ